MSHVTESPKMRTMLQQGGIWLDLWYITRWNKDGDAEKYITHKEDGPAHIEYFDTDKKQVMVEIWYRHGKPHRLDGPAMTMYHIDGSILRHRWHDGGNFCIDFDEWADVVDIPKDEKVRMKIMYGGDHV